MDPFKLPFASKIKGLKCDNTECDYRDEEIDSVDYHKHIDAPCPKCGDNLLTQADYDKVQELQKSLSDLNNIFGDLKDMGMPMGDGDGKRIDLKNFFGDDENINEEIKRFSKLI